MVAPDLPGYGRSPTSPTSPTTASGSTRRVHRRGRRARRRARGDRRPRLGRPARVDHGPPVPRADRGRDRCEHARPAPPDLAAGAVAARRSSSTRRSTSSSSRTAASRSGCSAWGGAPHDDFVDMIFGPDDREPRRVPARGARRLQATRSAGAGALTPPIEYYRNMDRNWELTAAIADRTIDVPCLMISAEDDRCSRPR